MILIVDDNAGIRDTIKGMLQEAESEFCECNDGRNAFEMYKKYKPDWVLMDVRMNLVDGITAAREITFAFPDARVIMVSNYSDAILKTQAHEAGAIAYVIKDDLSRLLDIMQNRSGQA